VADTTIETKLPPLSNAWRINKSSVPAIELANCLRSARRLIGHVTRKKEISVSYGPSSYYQVVHKLVDYEEISSTLKLDASLVQGTYPVPPDNMDRFCGQAIHEAMHSVLQSNVVIRVPMPTSPTGITFRSRTRGGNTLPFPTPDAVSAVTNKGLTKYWEQMKIVAEEIAVDSQVSGKLREYVKKARLMEGEPTVDWNNPFSVWIAIDVYNMQPNMDGVSVQQLEIIGVLLSIGKELKKGMASLRNPTHRIDILIHKWQELLPHLKSVEQKANMGSTDVPEGLEAINDPVFGGEYSSADGTDSKNAEPTPTPEPSTSKSQAAEEPAPTSKPQSSNSKPSKQTEETEESVGEEESGPVGGPEPEDEDYDEEDKAEEVSTHIVEAHQGTDKPLSSSMLEQINQHIAAESEDLTDQIKDMIVETTNELREAGQLTNDVKTNLVDFGHGTDKSVVWGKSVDTIPVKNFDEKLLKELEWIRQLKKALGSTIYRPEEDGTLDDLNLHRFAIDGHIYKRKVEKPNQVLKLAMVIDASGSMSNKTDIYKAAFAVCKILPQVKMYSYEHSSGTINLKLHTLGKLLTEVEIGGDTPSGQAILGTAIKHPDHLILHFTDGGANTGSDPNTAFLLMQKKFPKAYVLNVIYEPRINDNPYQRATRIPNDRITRMYQNVLPNNSYVVISSLDEFPRLLKGVMTRLVTTL